MSSTIFSQFPKYSVLLGAFYFFILTSCNGQTHKNKSDALQIPDSGMSLFSDSLNRPDIKVNVNKRYDENGNIIKYDSSYTYVYKGKHSDISLNNDSLFKHFKSYFNKQSFNQLGIPSNDVFFNDSLFQYDFFNDDYFQKRFELNQTLFADFFKQMDSLKKDYLKDNYLQAPKKSK